MITNKQHYTIKPATGIISPEGTQKIEIHEGLNVLTYSFVVEKSSALFQVKIAKADKSSSISKIVNIYCFIFLVCF